MMDFFYKQGGNFIDTANGYQAEESEQWIGEWLEKTGRRDEIVLATKYTSGFKTSQGEKLLQSNFGGTGSKSMHLSLEASLKKLRTDYIDLVSNNMFVGGDVHDEEAAQFYVHVWDYATSIPELMQSLNHLVQQRKVLYLGVSDTPAWVVVRARTRPEAILRLPRTLVRRRA